MKVLVSNVQRFCVHDGPGIRTTVFAMGCDIRCPWCCNPENLSHSIKKGKKHIWGCEYEENNLIELLLRDSAYYRAGGGITFSGGEFLLHLDEFGGVLFGLKEKGINLCVETSLFAPAENVKRALDVFDEFIIDFKVLDPKKALSILSADLGSFINNLHFFENKPFVARIPLSKETIDEKNLCLIVELFKKIPPERVEIFKIHNLGNSKYEDLSLTNSYLFDDIKDARVASVEKFLKDNGFVSSVIGI